VSEPEVLCARCARHQKTCCQRAEVFITLGDVRRIRDLVGEDGFAEFRVPEDPDYADQSDDPTWAHGVFHADGTRRVLRRQANGDCTFLGPMGCVLPLEVRPLVCRLYPFDYDERGIDIGLAAWCPKSLLAPGETLVGSIGMSREDSELWHRQLYAEIREETPRQDRPRGRPPLRPCA
jgi:Fe-S-cluster containining protein